MPHRTVIGGDLRVSMLGLGTVKLGRNLQVKYPRAFRIPTCQQALHLLKRAADLGVNLLDTAPAYGNSEQRLGKLLRGWRSDWVLCTKVGEEWRDGESRFDFRSQSIRASVQRSLQRLATDYLDILLLHSDGTDVEIIRRWGALDVLAEMKREGLIRTYGMSVKTVEGGLLAASRSDVIMLSYNLMDTEQKIVLERCEAQGTAVLLKKVFASGWLCTGDNGEQLQRCMDFIFANRAVTSAIVGTINPVHLEKNVQAARRAAC